MESRKDNDKTLLINSINEQIDKQLKKEIDIKKLDYDKFKKSNHNDAMNLIANTGEIKNPKSHNFEKINVLLFARDYLNEPVINGQISNAFKKLKDSMVDYPGYTYTIKKSKAETQELVEQTLAMKSPYQGVINGKLAQNSELSTDAKNLINDMGKQIHEYKIREKMDKKHEDKIGALLLAIDYIVKGENNANNLKNACKKSFPDYNSGTEFLGSKPETVTLIDRAIELNAKTQLKPVIK